MEPIELWIGIIFLILGYLVGSVNPGYIFGKVAKKIDIREHGTKNAGTSNAFKVLGLGYAIPTAIYDALKGILMMYFAYLTFAQVSGGITQETFIFIQVTGLMAIAGHIFPFYLKFRGGQGLATATGILLYYIAIYFVTDFFGLLAPFIIICVLSGMFYFITHIGHIIPIIVLPVFGWAVFVTFPGNPYNLFFWILLVQFIIIGIIDVIRRKDEIKIDDETVKTHWWRIATRPFAMFFVMFYILYDQMIALMIIGIVGLVFIAMDLSRILHQGTEELLTQKIKRIFRKEETKKFSSMTIFLVAFFIMVLLFEKEIAIASASFLVFGDMFSKLFGLAFGRHYSKRLNKSLEGTLAFYGVAIIIGYILYTTLDPTKISLAVIFTGVVVAPLAELFSGRINDNFTVGIISGATMTAVKFFGF